MNRTFPDNVKFRKTADPCLQHTLYNVLVAYGHHNKAVGYCQVCDHYFFLVPPPSIGGKWEENLFEVHFIKSSVLFPFCTEDTNANLTLMYANQLCTEIV